MLLLLQFAVALWDQAKQCAGFRRHKKYNKGAKIWNLDECDILNAKTVITCYGDGTLQVQRDGDRDYCQTAEKCSCFSSKGWGGHWPPFRFL